MRAIFSIFLAGLLSASLLAADPPSKADSKKGEGKKEKSTSFWMEKKLDYSQAILRGLAEGDFQSIGVNGGQMRLLSKVEGFVRRKDPNYRTQLHTFENVCDEIVRQANRENLEGVALAFNQLTVSCVSCHQTLRQKQGANDVSTKPRAKKRKAE